MPRGIFGAVLQGGRLLTKNQSDSETKAELLTEGGASLWGRGRVPICEGEMGRLQTYPRQQRAPGGGNIAALADRK